MRLLWALLLITFVSAPTLAGDSALLRSDITQVVLLGSGNPNPLPDRAGTAIAVIVNDQPYIFDAGEGVMRRAEAARQKHALAGLGATKFNKLFLTHLHWDHTVGVPEVMMSPWTQGRTGPLEIYGPLGTADMAKHLVAAYSADVEIRTKGLEPAPGEGWRVAAIEFDRAYTYKDENVTIEAFPVCHGDVVQAVGYKVTTPDRVIVISGDTAYCPIVAEKAMGADILMHEGYPTKSHAKLPADWSAYHTAFHTSAVDIARIANVAKPKLVVLYHQLTWKGDPLSMMTDEIAETHKGAVVNGTDLDIF